MHLGTGECFSGESVSLYDGTTRFLSSTLMYRAILHCPRGLRALWPVYVQTCNGSECSAYSDHVTPTAMQN